MQEWEISNGYSTHVWICFPLLFWDAFTWPVNYKGQHKMK